MSGWRHDNGDVALAHLSDLVAVRGWDAAAGVYDCAEGKAVIVAAGGGGSVMSAMPRCVPPVSRVRSTGP